VSTETESYDAAARLVDRNGRKVIRQPHLSLGHWTLSLSWSRGIPSPLLFADRCAAHCKGPPGSHKVDLEMFMLIAPPSQSYEVCLAHWLFAFSLCPPRVGG